MEKAEKKIIRDQPNTDYKAYYASIVEFSDDAIYGKSLNGAISSWNRGAEKLFGYTAREIIGKPISVLIPPHSLNELPAILEQVIAGKKIDHYETKRQRKDGTIIDVSMSVSPIIDQGGKIIGAATIARDISGRAQASQYARSLIEASLDPLVTISPEGKITDVNEATISVTGVDRDKLIGTDFSDYFTAPDEAREGYQQVLKDGFVTDYPLTIRHRNGKLIEVLYNASVYKDISGNVLGVFAAARDVTQTQQASQYARSLIEASLDPLVTISPEGKITDVNDATIKVTGIDREKLIATDFSDYFTEPDKARQGYQQVLKDGYVTDYPLTIRHRASKLTEVLYNASVYKDVSGKVLGVFAAARDITAQKKAEAEVTEQRKKELIKLAELERFQKLTVGRELKMIELKKEIEEMNERIKGLQKN